MLFFIVLLIVIIFLAFKIAPVEKEEHAHVHGVGQIGLLPLWHCLASIISLLIAMPWAN